MQVTNNILVFKLGSRFMVIYFIVNLTTNIKLQILFCMHQMLLHLKYFTDELVF